MKQPTVMKKSFALLAFLFAGLLSVNAQTITWMKWEDAIAANKKKPKLIFVDVYTSWCGWCKVMDQKTFSAPEVADFMSKNFYCVKFDAEQKGDVIYNQKTYKFNAQNRSHELAIALLDGRMSYPSFVFLNSKEQRISIEMGYKEVAPWMEVLKNIVANNK
jgi:uncharacterized protein YyaL (SSP411 family)